MKKPAKTTASARVTIYQIAEKAGCSAMTVSRALMPKQKADDRINPQTRLFIQKLAKEMGYKPNTAARSLTLRKTYNVGFHINQPMNYYQHLHFKTLRKLQQVLEGGGYHLGFYYFEADNIPELQHFLKPPRMVDAVVALGRNLSQHEVKTILDSEVPRISLFAEHEQFHSLMIDDYRGGQLVARYLYEQGFREVATMFLPLVLPQWNGRVIGFQEEAAKLGMKVVQVDDFHDPRYPAHYAWVRGLPAPDILSRIRALGRAGRCLFVNSDSFALGLVKLLDEAGIALGQDISIIGYDNIEEDNPPGGPPARLTTVSRPRAELGEYAAKLILDENTDYCSKTFLPTLVTRQSVGAP